MESKTQKRQVAYKIMVNDILKGEYVKEDGEWAPNYIKVGNKKVSRVNLMAVVVSKQDLENTNYQNILVDDGSGRISIRNFEEDSNFKSIEVGDFVLIIGRPREYLNEKYIVSEIIRKTDNTLWMEAKKLELSKGPEIKTTETKEVIEEEIKENVEEGIRGINSQIFNLIKEIDKGEGANIQDVITKSQIVNVEEIIKNLLKHGEVFEIKPGKLKVLE